jgi:hypothetical protein
MTDFQEGINLSEITEPVPDPAGCIESENKSRRVHYTWPELKTAMED